jgi:hypothetical protein
LDILLLGYLCENDITKFRNFIPVKTTESRFYFNYPEDTWGAQMYLLSKKSSQVIIDKYYTTYADRTLHDNTLTCFSSDWLITKYGNRALLFPLLVIEDFEFNVTKYANTDIQEQEQGQIISRINCFNLSYRTDTFF